MALGGNKMESFAQLEVWQKAHARVLRIYEITKEFLRDERFRVVDQLCRSAASVPADITEGKGRNTRKEYIQFLYNARGSREETKYHLILSGDLGYLSPECINNLMRRITKLAECIMGSSTL